MKTAVIGLSSLLLLTAAHAQDELVQLQFRQPPGEAELTRYHRLVQTLTVGGQPLETSSETTQSLRMTTSQPDDDGQVRVVYSPLRTQSTLTMPGGETVRFDSQNPKATPQPRVPQGDRLLTDLKVAAGLIRTEVFDAKHQLVRVEVAGENVTTMTDEARRRWSSVFLKTQRLRELAVIPQKPLRADDSWVLPAELDLGRGQLLKTRTRYVYKGSRQQGDRTLTIIASEVLDVQLAMTAREPVRVTDSELKPIRSTGEIRFDMEAGRIIYANSRLQAVGAVTLSTPGTTVDGRLNLTILTRDEFVPDP